MRFDGTDVLIFDLEARPTAWIGGDYVGRSVTAYAYCYLDSDEVTCHTLLGPGTPEERMADHALMVAEVAAAVETADLVVGHWVRGFDLPLLNAETERVKGEPLPRVLTIDTKSDRLTGSGLSQSLENLAFRYDTSVQKMDMREPMWEEYNLWQTERSIRWVRDRVSSDILATRELYIKMNEAGRLNGPKAWDPAHASLPKYAR
jgi:hypothetical protein